MGWEQAEVGAERAHGTAEAREPAPPRGGREGAAGRPWPHRADVVLADRTLRAPVTSGAPEPRREGTQKATQTRRPRHGSSPEEGTAMTISRMLYVDDSGAVDHGLLVYGWIEVAPERWRHRLRTILELRTQLYLAHHVPPAGAPPATTFRHAPHRN